VHVKHCDPQSVLVLNKLWGLPKIALKAFLARYSKNTWMQKQRLYVQSAAIAAAHERMGAEVGGGEYPAGHLHLSHFDGVAFLNCGWAFTDRSGHRHFRQCRQTNYCPSCNRWLRVEPAKAEFLPAFGSAPLWYSITVIGRSNPDRAGVTLEVGRDADDKPVVEHLFRLADTGEYPRLHKYDASCWQAPMVGMGLYDFLVWLVRRHYFNGLQLAYDMQFKYFPDPLSPVGVSHTVNPHFHGYGNMSRTVDARRAERMWLGAFNALLEAAGGDLWAYPDFYHRPLPTVESVKKAINYVFKPFRFAKAYIQGLQKGCPVVGLNMEFHTTFFDSEVIPSLFPSPSGLSKYGARLGNMAQKDTDGYIGTPLPKKMSARQVERFLARLKNNEARDWEIQRYDNHLALIAKKRRREFPGHARNTGTDTDDY